MEVTIMASMTSLPHKSYFSTVLQMRSLLTIKHNGAALLYPADPEIDLTQIPTEDQSEEPCGPCKEDAPSNAHYPRDKGFDVRAFVDSDYAGHSVTRHSRTGFIVLLSDAHDFSFSKKQGRHDISSFVSKLTAMKSFCE